MCGRYLITSPLEAILEMFAVDPADRPNLEPRFNLAPTQQAPVVRRGDDGARHLALLRWGLIPHWAKDVKIGARLINARAETAATAPAFRESARRRRCLVVADGFFEWQKQGKAKQPFLIRRRDNRPMAFAGLWSAWTDPQGARLETFTIITTAADAMMAAIHDRMPLILPSAAWPAWLDPSPIDIATLGPADGAEMTAVPISTRVNSVKNDDAEVIVPLAEQPTLL
ncbi:MAG: SOS response-associated peptidase [Rhodospirillaceae bacterium]|nr:SOS response-associated peptidase [Rhodospirillaceae bacterium]